MITPASRCHLIPVVRTRESEAEKRARRRAAWTPAVILPPHKNEAPSHRHLRNTLVCPAGRDAGAGACPRFRASRSPRRRRPWPGTSVSPPNLSDSRSRSFTWGASLISATSGYLLRRWGPGTGQPDQPDPVRPGRGHDGGPVGRRDRLRVTLHGPWIRDDEPVPVPSWLMRITPERRRNIVYSDQTDRHSLLAASSPQRWPQ